MELYTPWDSNIIARDGAWEYSSYLEGCLDDAEEKFNALSRRLELAEALAKATTNLRQKYCGNCAEKWGGDTCEYCRAWEADKALRAFEEVG